MIKVATILTQGTDLMYIRRVKGTHNDFPPLSKNMTDYLPEVFAIDPKDGKTKFRFDETTELKIEDFLSKVELENHFTKIADACIKPKKRFSPGKTLSKR